MSITYYISTLLKYILTAYFYRVKGKHVWVSILKIKCVYFAFFVNSEENYERLLENTQKIPEIHPHWTVYSQLVLNLSELSIYWVVRLGVGAVLFCVDSFCNVNAIMLNVLLCLLFLT